ncbi:hypothetical protein HDU97_000713 [Phlyctochytrium planicorne]|nr:hypothetical protein HDU97_000713 [Phlyctochytrium planicorne]
MAALIQGSSRGIGLALVKRLVLDSSATVISTSRNPDRAKQNLQDILKGHESFSNIERRVHFLKMDVTKEGAIEQASQEIKSILGQTSVHLLVNSSGFLNPEKSLQQVTEETILDHLKTNLVGPVLTAKHFAPLMTKGKQEEGTDPKSLKSLLPNPLLVNISARTGSIGDNKLGGWYSYRISKAALNQATKTLSVEIGRKGIVAVSLHPGTVDTDLSRNFVKNAPHVLKADESASLLWNVMRKLTLEHNGTFLDQNGLPIIW